MADTPFATASDVEARWRTLTSEEETVAETLCADASDMIRSRWPDVDDRIAVGTLSADSLLRVVANMVKRAMINAGTEGVESRQQTAGPFGVNDKFANPDANLYFNAEDLRLLDGRGARRAFAVDLTAPPTSGDYYAAYYCQ